MSIEKKLDIVLDYYRRNKMHNEIEWQVVSEAVGVDLKEILMKLIKDEYIVKREGLSEHQLTIEGQLFGGYKSQRNWKTLKQFALFMESLLLVVFSGIGAAWAIIEIFNDLFSKE